jgi:hypothetical protein
MQIDLVPLILSTQMRGDCHISCIGPRPRDVLSVPSRSSYSCIRFSMTPLRRERQIWEKFLTTTCTLYMLSNCMWVEVSSNILAIMLNPIAKGSAGAVMASNGRLEFQSNKYLQSLVMSSWPCCADAVQYIVEDFTTSLQANEAHRFHSSQYRYHNICY